MDRYILCLANSYKHGGRCLAGIEATCRGDRWTIVRKEDGTPRWLRPVSRHSTGEIPNEEALGIELFSLVKIADAEPFPQCAHSENVFYSRLESCDKSLMPNRELLNNLVDNYHHTVFFNRGRAVAPDCFQVGNYSLMLVRAENAEIRLGVSHGKLRYRLSFRFHDTEYDLPITDPEYLAYLRCIGATADIPEELFLVLSLGLEHEGWHPKLVATVIECPEEERPVKPYAPQEEGTNGGVSEPMVIYQREQPSNADKKTLLKRLKDWLGF